MRVAAKLKDGRLHIYLSGDLDHHGAKAAMTEIEEEIDLALPRDCVIDMSGLTFMDSSGIAVILKTHKRMNELGGRTWVENVPKQPMRVLDASGIERLIRISSLA